LYCAMPCALLVNKYRKVDTKTLKLVTSDFYTVDVLSDVKFKLLEVVDNMKLLTKRPQIGCKLKLRSLQI